MRIEELLTESTTDEGVLDTVGKTVGNVAGGAANAVGATVGGIRGMGDKFKQGFNRGRKFVNGVDKGAQDPKSPYYDLTGIAPDGQQQAGGAPAQGGAQGQDPKALRQQGQALIKQADDLEKQQKSQGQQQQQSAGQQQSGGQQAAPTGGAPVGSQSNADGGANAAPAQGQTPPAQDTGDGRVEPTMDPNAAPAPEQGQQAAPANATPPETAPQDPNATPKPTAAPAGQQQQATGKMTPDQIAAAKKKAQSGIARTKNNPSGFKNSRVGVPVQKMTGADAQGNPVFSTVRESRAVAYSKFLGAYI